LLKNRAGYLSEPLFVGFVGVSGFDKYVESGESFNLFNHGSDLFGKAVPVLLLMGVPLYAYTARGVGLYSLQSGLGDRA